MSVDVTVVVPVYNPGRYLDVLLDSLFTQSLPIDRREYLFVDDGSTDDTPARLDDLAAEHVEVRVIHQENSGWPGKPRNVGIDNAQGDYVFFSDHDDRLGPEALERMVAMARRTGADVLIPKMVGNGRPVPHRLFIRSIDDATLGVDPLMESLTPHKLFRREFLNDVGLRFPEGRRRLEDHVFVVEAFLRATVISVMADYPGYHRVHRDDDGNASVQGLDPDFYFQFVAETLDVIERLTEPGELRNTLLVRPYGGELVGKLAEKRLRRWDEDMRQRIVDRIRPLMVDRFPAEIADQLPIARRAHAHAILDNDLGRLLRVADLAAAPEARAELADLVWTGDRWRGTVEVELQHPDGSPIELRPLGDRVVIDPRLFPPELGAADYARDDVLSGYADVIVRDADSVEWYVAATITPELSPIDAGSPGVSRLVFRGHLALDPLTVVGGRAMDPGDWDVRVRMEALGIARHLRLRAATDISPPAALCDEAIVVAPIVGPKLGVSVTVSAAPKSLVRLVAQHIRDVAIDSAGRVQAGVDLVTIGSSLPGQVPLSLHGPDGEPVASYACQLENRRLRSQPVDPTLVPDGGLTVTLLDPARGRGFVVGVLHRSDGQSLRIEPTEFRAFKA